MASLLKKIADRRGDAVALTDASGSVSWPELNRRVNRLIAGLRAAGLGTGDTIAMMVGNQNEYYEIMAACTHGGWTVVPVNWHWVADELTYVLDDSDAKALIVDGRFLEVAAEAVPRVEGCSICLLIGAEPPAGFQSYGALLAAADSAEPDGEGLGGPMFYTSGTTGFPKGVRSGLNTPGLGPEIFELVSHGACAQLGIEPDGTVLLCGPAYHSAQWAFSYFPLLTGNTLVLQHKFDPAEVLELIDRHRVNWIHLVPTQFVRMLNLDRETRDSFEGSSLRRVYHGAAPCPLEIKRQMLDWWGPVISEYYGGTEGGFLSIVGAEEWLEKPGTLGKPLETIEIVIVDENGAPVGPGVSGQIYFRNRRGTDFEYHKAPEKTAAAHLEPGLGTLGDVGYLDEDGYLFLSDRKIDMIISGGVNIYPAEIEGTLVNHPAVADAAVFGVPHAEMGEEVKAAVELTAGQTASPELADELIAHCRAHLAGYKAPRSIDFEKALPRHPTGKLYKRILRDRYWEKSGRKI
jgi:long-chain acyl-CoA synthetase